MHLRMFCEDSENNVFKLIISLIITVFAHLNNKGILNSKLKQTHKKT